MIFLIALVLFLSTASSEIQHKSLVDTHPIFAKLLHHLSYQQEFSNRLKQIGNAHNINFQELISGNSCLQIPSQECYLALKKISQRIIPKYLDSLGKPPTGIFEGNLGWIGNYEECMTIPNAHYCDMKNVAINISQTIPLSTLGVCIPEQCSIHDVTKLLNSTSLCLQQYFKLKSKIIIVKPLGISRNQGLGNPQVESLCFSNKTYATYTTGATVMIVISSIILALCFAGTITELAINFLQSLNESNTYSDELTTPSLQTSKPVKPFQLTKNNNANKFLTFMLCFSVVKNSKAIFNTNVPAGAISSINGIRTISITWVILGHMMLHLFTNTANPSIVFAVWVKRFSFQAIANAPLSVDTFFVLSGLLVSYLSFKRFETHGKLPLLRYYLHRYIRLTPSYLYLIMFMMYLYPYLGSGPFWRGSPEIVNCQKNWWTNILYINNIYPEIQNDCYAVSWYLANDMQFYVVSPLILWAMYRFRIVGVLLTSSIILFEYILANGLLIHYKNASPLFITKDTTSQGATLSYQKYIYFKPWTRMAPYIIGIILGYVIFYKKTLKFGRYSALYYIGGWLVAFGMGFGVIYGPYTAINDHNWSEGETITYGILFRIAWSIAVCWVIYACHNGYGSIINDFLGWKVFIPLSRLTYGVYLIHYYVLDFIFDQMKITFYVSEVSLAFVFIPVIFVSYFLSYIVAVCIEFPIFNLEKLVMKH